MPKYLGREIIIFYIFENVVIRFVIAIADVCSTSDDDNRISLVNFKQHITSVKVLYIEDAETVYLTPPASHVMS